MPDDKRYWVGHFEADFGSETLIYYKDNGVTNNIVGVIFLSLCREEPTTRCIEK